MNKHEPKISAFAYNTAKEIENTIIARTNDLEETNRTLQALILSYRNSIVNPKELEIFEKHFNVKSPKIGQTIQVRGMQCRIFKVREFGTIDVVSLCGNYAYRLSGLNF